jgi:hypothetical protein
MRWLTFIVGMIVVLAGCSKKTNAPAAPDLYAPMYGTWYGHIGQEDPPFSPFWLFPDSIRVEFSPGGSLPVVRLWLRPNPTNGREWREVAASVTGPVDLRLIPGAGINTFDCGVYISIGADSLNLLPESRWWGGHYTENGTGATRLFFWGRWPGIADSMGETNPYLSRL